MSIVGELHEADLRDQPRLHPLHFVDLFGRYATLKQIVVEDSIRGTEVTLRSPRMWPHGQFHLAYSYQTAQGRGSISGGLTDFSSGGDYFLLDHDQRHTLSTGFDARLSKGVFAATNVYYGSGFTDSGGPAHLPGHTTVNVSLGKSLGDKASVAVTALNVTNSHVLIDNSLTFGGTHFNNPREVYGELRYHFHY